jgi:GTPase SAR1 family protein
VRSSQSHSLQRVLKVRLQLWDTVGQERFMSIVRSDHQSFESCFINSRVSHFQAPMYYCGAHVALLLHDIMNVSTFEDVKGWLEGAVVVLQSLDFETH